MNKFKKFMIPSGVPIDQYKNLAGGTGGITKETFEITSTGTSTTTLSESEMVKTFLDFTQLTTGQVSIEYDGVEKEIVSAGSETTEFEYGADTDVDIITQDEGFNLSDASYDSVSFSVAIEDTAPYGIFFKPDGSKMYMIGDTNNSIYQYTLSTPWDISTATYDSVSFSVTSQETLPLSFYIKSDGIKLYVAGSSNSIHQYTLSTPWDIGTGSYDSVSFSLTGQGTAPYGITFNSYGTKFYTTQGSSSTLYQYTLSTPWDLSTASYDSVSFDTSSQNVFPTTIRFNKNGDKLYMAGNTAPRTVFQYTLSTPYDLSTMSYDGINFSVNSQVGTFMGLFFKSNGSKFYALDLNGTIYQYSSSTPFSGTVYASTEYNSGLTQEVYKSTATETNTLTLSEPTTAKVTVDVSGLTTGQVSIEYDGVEKEIVSAGSETTEFEYGADTDVDIITQDEGFNLSDANFSGLKNFSEGSALGGTRFNNDGTKSYIVDRTTDTIYQYDLSTAYDMFTATYSNISFTQTEETSPYDIFFKNDGTKLYIIGTVNDSIYQYTLSTPWDISTATYDSVSFDVSSQIGIPTGVNFKIDGTKMYITGGGVNESIYQYTLSTPWDISTASYDSVSFTSTEDIRPASIVFKPDGTKLYYSGTTNNTIYQYTLSTPWDLSTASYDSVSFNPDFSFATTGSIYFDTTGTLLYQTLNASVYKIFLSSAYDISTAKYGKTFNVSGQDTSPCGLYIREDGVKMYIAFAPFTDKIHQYTLSTPWDISTASYDSISLNTSAQTTTIRDVYFKSDGGKIYALDSNTNSVYQYTLSTPWDIGTGSYDSVSFSIAGQSTSMYGMFFKPDGTKIYMVGAVAGSVYQYTLSTAWDLSTASYDSVSFSIVSEQSQPTDIFFRDTGLEFYIIGGIGSNNLVHKYTISTPWDISTASYSGVSFDASSQDSQTWGLSFKPDGSKFYVLGDANDSVYQYSSSTPFSGTVYASIEY